MNPIDFVSSFPAHLPYAALREVGLRLAGPRSGHDESRAAGHRLGLFIVVGPQVVPYLMCKGHRRLRAACGDLKWHLQGPKKWFAAKEGPTQEQAIFSGSVEGQQTL